MQERVLSTTLNWNVFSVEHCKKLFSVEYVYKYALYNMQKRVLSTTGVLLSTGSTSVQHVRKYAQDNM
jgi:hypothetical protein